MKEIERKFLVTNEDWLENNTLSSANCKQAYLSTNDKFSTRVRLHNGCGSITIKTAVESCTRNEYEMKIPSHEAEELFEICVSEIVEKIRHRLVYKGHLWEIDVFVGGHEGLIMAEIELNSEDENFEMPPWLGEEVTADDRYYNENIAVDGVPCRHKYVHKVVDENAFPYGDTVRYDKCENCGERLNFKVN